MSSRDTKLNIVVDAQNKATSGLRSVSNELDATARSANNSSSSFWGLTKNLAAVAGAYISFNKVFEAANVGLTMAADMQTAEVGLKTLLGSAEEAHKTIERLKVEAARTPFELAGLTQATQLLTSVTKDGDKSIDILLNVGEALSAMGKGQAELDRIIVNLQQVAAVGKASTMDIKQFAFAGIPIYEMLAETTGKTGEALAELVESGGVTFEMLTKMFDEANNEGGRFFNAFVNQSGTFNQAASNMKDSFGIMMQDIVQSSGLFDGITQGMLGASESMSNWKGTVDTIKTSFFDFFTLFDEKTLVITHFTGIINSLSETFKTILKPSLDEFMIAIQPLMPYIQALGQVLVGMFIIALHGVAAALRVISVALAGVLSALTIIATFIADTVVFVFRTLQNTVELLANVFTGDWGGAITAVKNQISDLINWVSNLIDMFKRAIDLASELGGGAAKFIKKALPGRASGGPVTGNSPYMVGEVGPELFVPSSSGTIIPNHKLGGGSINITITGNSFMSNEDAAEKVGDMIMSRLRLSNAL